MNGPDGNLWFTEFNGNRIGRATPAGSITEYSLQTPSSEPWVIVAGPDSALWFAQYGGSAIGRITTTGSVTEYTLPTANSIPAGIAVGPDNAIWFSEYNRAKLGRIAITVPPVLSIAKSHSGSFSPSQQGAAYTVTVSNAAGSLATSGTVTVTENPPAGLTLVSMSGTGWTCTGTTCTRGDALAGGASYPPITVTVNVAYDAASPQVNAVSVSGGGSARQRHRPHHDRFRRHSGYGH